MASTVSKRKRGEGQRGQDENEDPNTSIGVRDFLVKRCKFQDKVAEKYFQAFAQNGYETMEFLSDLTESKEFDEIESGMPIGHRRRILKMLRMDAEFQADAISTDAQASENIDPTLPKTPWQENCNPIPSSAPTKREVLFYEPTPQHQNTSTSCLPASAMPSTNPELSQLKTKEESSEANQCPTNKVDPKDGLSCIDWEQTGSCDMENCPFLHEARKKEISGERTHRYSECAAATASLGPRQVGGEFPELECFEWKKSGYCSYGRRCMYKHVGAGHVHLCDSWREKGECKFGDRCRFSHDISSSSGGEENTQKVFVGGLPQDVKTGEDLGKLFEDVGEVLNAWVARDKITGFSRGFGFVVFGNHDAATKALQTEIKIANRKLDIKIAKENYKKNMVCEKCGQKGHRGLLCPMEGCFICKKVGHFRFNCPEGRK